MDPGNRMAQCACTGCSECHQKEHYGYCAQYLGKAEKKNTAPGKQMCKFCADERDKGKREGAASAGSNEERTSDNGTSRSVRRRLASHRALEIQVHALSDRVEQLERIRERMEEDIGDLRVQVYNNLRSGTGEEKTRSRSKWNKWNEGYNRHW